MATERRAADDLVALYNRWGITVNEAEFFDHFKHRVIVALQAKSDWNVAHSTAVLRHLAIIRGYSTPANTVADVLAGMGDLNNFLVTAQLLFWAIRDANEESTYGVSSDPLLEALVNGRNRSPMIDFLVIDRFGTATILPAGARELDLPLVAETLTWLSPHTKIAAKFEKALRAVLGKDPASYRSALDDLRWSLEQLLRVVLENNRPIEDQKTHLAKWAKNRGVHQSVVHLFIDLLKHFADYQNDAVKHDEKWSEDEIEFMVYLTGSFMRLLLRLSAKDATAARS
jgi:hypothetical protein